MKRHLLIGSLVTATALVTAGCSGGSGDTPAESPSSSSAPSETSGSTPSPSESETTTAEAASGPVGPGCADYAAQVPDGPGSVDGMAQDPVATAASNNPVLTQLTAAVSGGLNPEVNLVDTLNGSDFTVFAPVDSAFAGLPPETVETLKTDPALLSKILTYHVVPGKMSPADVAGKELTTVEGQDVTVGGTPEMLTVNGANVICGGVDTANATVYLIDGVMTPPAA